MATARNIRGLRLIYRENNPGQVDSQFLYYLHNAHGDVTQLLNEQGQLIKDYRYDTFGQEEMPEAQVFGGKQTGELWRQEVEKIDNPFRYCGEYLDEETGNYYLRARYYDPSIQRFVNEDSYVVFKGAKWPEHGYNYVGNNPISRIDPSGHGIISDIASTVGSVIGGPVGSVIAAIGAGIDSALSSGNHSTDSKTVTKASINKNAIISAGPSKIQFTGMNEARKRMDPILDNYRWGGWFLGSYCIREWSYGTYFTDQYNSAKERAETIKSWLSAVDLAMDVAEATDETGTWYGGLGIGVLNWLFDPKPSLADTIDLTSKSVARAKGVMDYVNNSQFKYLIYATTPREHFIESLKDLKKEILAHPPTPYNNLKDNKEYQNALIGYIDGTIKMNTDFDTSKDNMFLLMANIK